MKIDCKFPWKTQPLSQIITDTVSGVSLGDNDFTDNGFPVAHKGDVRTSGVLDLSPRNSRYVSGKSFELNKRAQVTSEYLVVSLRDLVPTAPQLGLINKLPADQSRVLLAQGTYGFIVDPKLLDKTFLSQLSSADFFRSTMKKNAVGSTQKHLRSTEFFELEVPVPPIEEQEKIAKILSTWDEAIETNLNLLKVSQTLHKAVSRIIFLDIDCDQLKASEICDVRDGTHDSPKPKNEGIPLLTSKNIMDGKINFHDAKLISNEDADAINKRSKVDKNDILFSMIGTVGAVALVTEEPNFCIKNVGLFKPDSRHILPAYLLSYFQSSLFQDEVKRTLDGGIQKFLSLGALRNLMIPVPGINEQEKIANTLDVCKSNIELLQKKIFLIKKQKSGLMQQLLTGKKRVKV